MFDQDTILAVQGAIAQAIEHAKNEAGGALKKHVRISVSMRALLHKVEDLHGTLPSAERVLKLAAQLGVTRSMGVIHRHIRLNQEFSRREGEPATEDFAAAVEAQPGTMPPEIAELVTQVGATLERIREAVPRVVEADRRLREGYHREEIDRLRIDYERRLAEELTNRKAALGFAEECVADADESAEALSAMQIESEGLAAELAAVVEDRNALRAHFARAEERYADLERAFQQQHAALLESRGAAAVQARQEEELRERLDSVTRQLTAKREELATAREETAAALSRTEQLERMIAAQQEQIRAFNVVLGDSIVALLGRSERDTKEDPVLTP